MTFTTIIDAIKFLRATARTLTLTAAVTDAGDVVTEYRPAFDLKTAKLFVEAVMALGVARPVEADLLAFTFAGKVEAIKHVRTLARTATLTTTVTDTGVVVTVETGFDLKMAKDTVRAIMALGHAVVAAA
jgi:hypothetical protein